MAERISSGSSSLEPLIPPLNPSRSIIEAEENLEDQLLTQLGKMEAQSKDMLWPRLRREMEAGNAWGPW